MKQKIYCVISHTHWDREWYYTFEHFRMKLVDLFNNLFNILEKYPEYIFHLDAQTIVVDDYLEICPYNRNLLLSYIKKGNLIVGPWYIQNDFYLTDGESTIRNLLIGSKASEEMGCFMKIGYIPDQFGNISQLPQIFNGFNIKYCIFGRGYSFYKENEEGNLERNLTPAGFKWCGQDGSEVLNIRFSTWYNNAQRFSEDVKKSLGIIDIAVSKCQGQEQTPYYLFMNGVDHLEAQENLIPVMGKINAALPDGQEIKQYTMEQYCDEFLRCIKENNKTLSSYSGELRNGNDYDLLKGTLSSRIYLKTANVRLQNMLEKSVEPLYVMQEFLGFSNIYPSDYMIYLWKLLMQNHPHDSICGCSHDRVHEHMEDRFKRVEEVAEQLIKRGMETVTAHTSRDGMNDNDYLISVFNYGIDRESDVAELTLEFSSDDNVESFDILDENQNKIPYYILNKYIEDKKITSAINLPGLIETNCYRIRMLVPPMNGMSVRRFVLRPSKKASIGLSENKSANEFHMENKHLSVKINENGKMDLIYKKNGKIYENILEFYDEEECGTSYVHHNKGLIGRVESMEERFKPFCSDNGNIMDKVREFITTEGLIPEITVLADNSVEQICKLTYNMEIPEKFNTEIWERSDNKLSNRIEVILNLKNQSKLLEIELKIDNKSNDHRLRLYINTGLKTDKSYGLTPFDVIERDRRNVLDGVQNGTQPNSGFVTVSDGQNSISIINEGVYEYEHLLNSKNTIAMTVLRSCGLLSRVRLPEIHSDMWQPGNQCLREITVRLAIYPHEGDYVDGNVANQMDVFQNPLLTFNQHFNPKRFSGGRPAVQDTDIAEIFFREDPYSNIIIPEVCQLFSVEGKGVMLSAVKQAQNHKMTVIRIYNLSDDDTVATLNINSPYKRACELMLNETVLNDTDVLNIQMKPKQIKTIGIMM